MEAELQSELISALKSFVRTMKKKKNCGTCRYWDREGPIIGLFNVPHFLCKKLSNSNHGEEPKHVYVMSKEKIKIATVSFFECGLYQQK